MAGTTSNSQNTWNTSNQGQTAAGEAVESADQGVLEASEEIQQQQSEEAAAAAEEAAAAAIAAAATAGPPTPPPLAATPPTPKPTVPEGLEDNPEILAASLAMDTAQAGKVAAITEVDDMLKSDSPITKQPMTNARIDLFREIQRAFEKMEEGGGDNQVLAGYLTMAIENFVKKSIIKVATPSIDRQSVQVALSPVMTNCPGGGSASVKPFPATTVVDKLSNQGGLNPGGTEYIGGYEQVGPPDPTTGKIPWQQRVAGTDINGNPAVAVKTSDEMMIKLFDPGINWI